MRFGCCGVVGLLVWASATASCSGGGANGQSLQADGGDDVSTIVDAGGGGETGTDGGASLCVDGQPAPYPTNTSIALLGTIPDLAFDSDGGALHMHDYYEPCAAQSRLLVVRVGAGWCGTCRWTVAHTKELLALDVGARLEILDLLVANDDNMPAVVADLATWRGRIDAPGKVAIDPTYQLGAVNPSRASLPLVVLVDSRTMTIEHYLNDPPPDLLQLRVRQDLARLDGVPPPTPVPLVTYDSRFTRNQWDMIHAMTPLEALPPDPTNAHADDAAAAALGQKLFSDKLMSPSGAVACSTCHDPTKHYTDGLPQAVGVAKGNRNSPSVLLASHQRWQFWDGRADTLWMQAVGPFENSLEFASSRLYVVHGVYDRYATDYQAVFGPLPPMNDTSRFPASGKPGDAEWTAMATADQDAVSRAYANVGKAIEAFERTLVVKTSALDTYAAGDTTALTDAQKDGLHAFFTGGCAQCHWGPRLTDDAFHDTRFPTGRQDGQADRGRIDGIPPLLQSPFNASGPFSDDAGAAHLSGVSADPSTLGAFKTPSLRGVADTAPYGHGGTLATLADVAQNYSTAGLDPSDQRAVGPSEPWLPHFDTPTRDALPAFLGVLHADPGP
jgi:cytochrome c peroxidase